MKRIQVRREINPGESRPRGGLIAPARCGEMPSNFDLKSLKVNKDVQQVNYVRKIRTRIDCRRLEVIQGGVARGQVRRVNQKTN